MDDITRAEKLLSLFTSADCASAIAGDLTEERRPGRIRFWLAGVAPLLLGGAIARRRMLLSGFTTIEQHR